MPIPVLVVVPAQEPIRESAVAFMEGRAPRMSLHEAVLPKRLKIHASMPAMPLGMRRPGDMAAVAEGLRQSETYAVRAMLDVERLEDVPESIDGHPVFSDPRIEPFNTCVNFAIGDAALVATRLNIAALTAGRRGLDGTNVAVAIVDTGFDVALLKTKRPKARVDEDNSWVPPSGKVPAGSFSLHHGTTSAFDVLIGAPKATLLDIPVLAAPAIPQVDGNEADRTISVAITTFQLLFNKWKMGFGPKHGPRYTALVINNSWGIFDKNQDLPVSHSGRYIDNPQHPFNQLVRDMAAAGIDIVFAAGNCGPDCPDGKCTGGTVNTIMGANAHLDVLTVAACDTSDIIAGYSSRGPAMAGWGVNKPDITAYAHFLGMEADAKGSPDAGTSAASPVAAGCVAALRTKLTPVAVPPARLFDQIRATARKVPPQAGWQVDFGHGIINPDAAGRALGV